eukprot:1385580-Rhodomonas_salina.1
MLLRQSPSNLLLHAPTKKLPTLLLTCAYAPITGTRRQYCGWAMNLRVGGYRTVVVPYCGTILWYHAVVPYYGTTV